MDLSDIKIGKELGKDWRPVGRLNAAAQRLIPWMAAPAAFSIGASAIAFFEYKVPGSPILFVFRGIGRILMAFFCLILGLVRLIFTGNAELLKGIGDCFRGAHSMVYSPLVLGLFGMIFILRILNRAGLSESHPLQVLLLSALLLVVLSSLQSDWTFGKWFSEFIRLLAELWGKA